MRSHCEGNLGLPISNHLRGRLSIRRQASSPSSFLFVDEAVGVDLSGTNSGTNLFDQAEKLAIAAALSAQQAAQQVSENAHQAIASVSTASDDTLKRWQDNVAAFSASGMVLTDALKDLPRTAQALAEEMPKLARRLQTAGTRLGDAPRSDADVMGLFDKIPGPSKLGVSEWNIRTFLSDKHGSHIHPHSKGGSNGADNVVWEIGADNIRRGARTMTQGEQTYIRFYNAVDSIVKNSTAVAKLGITATGTAVLTQALVTALAHSLDLRRGEITAEEFRAKIIDSAVSAGLATPVFFVVFIAVMALFPEVVVVLSAPAVVAGFNTLFGVSICLPLIASLTRHLKADGFGADVRLDYERAIARGEALTNQFFCNQRV